MPSPELSLVFDGRDVQPGENPQWREHLSRVLAARLFRRSALLEGRYASPSTMPGHANSRFRSSAISIAKMGVCVVLPKYVWVGGMA